MTAARILVVGDVVTDVVAVLSGALATGSDTPADVRLTGGGQAANTAAWLAWAGGRVTLVGAVGDDEPGHARLVELAGHGVDLAVRRRPDAPTGTVIVLTYGGERTMVTARGANLRLSAEDIESALAAAPDARHLHLSAYALLDAGSRGAGLAALAGAHDRGLTTSVDAASAQPLRQAGTATFLDWIRGVDLLLANADEAAVLTDGRDAEPAAWALTTVARHVVVKEGSAGAVWADGEALTRVPARRVPVVDATGAGDAFAAGLLAAWLSGADPRTALRRGNELGAMAVSVVGSRPTPRA